MWIWRALERISMLVVSQPSSMICIFPNENRCQSLCDPEGRGQSQRRRCKGRYPRGPTGRENSCCMSTTLVIDLWNCHWLTCLQEITAPVESQCFNFGPTGSIGLGLPTPSMKPSTSIAYTSTSTSIVYTPTPSTTPYTYTSSLPTTTSYSTPLSSSATVSPYHHYRRHNHRRHHGV